MTQNHQCVSNQKIQTACLFGRDKRSEEQAVFFALHFSFMTTIMLSKGRQTGRLPLLKSIGRLVSLRGQSRQRLRPPSIAMHLILYMIP